MILTEDQYSAYIAAYLGISTGEHSRPDAQGPPYVVTLEVGGVSEKAHNFLRN